MSSTEKITVIFHPAILTVTAEIWPQRTYKSGTRKVLNSELPRPKWATKTVRRFLSDPKHVSIWTAHEIRDFIAELQWLRLDRLQGQR